MFDGAFEGDVDVLIGVLVEAFDPLFGSNQIFVSVSGCDSQFLAVQAVEDVQLSDNCLNFIAVLHGKILLLIGIKQFFVVLTAKAIILKEKGFHVYRSIKCQRCAECQIFL